MLLEIIFRAPEWGILFLISLFFGGLYWLLARYKRERLSRYVVPENIPQRNWQAFFIRAFCLIVAMGLMVLSLMQPVDEQKVRSQLPTKASLDEIAFFLDLSGSMDAQDTATGVSRLNRAKEIIESILESLGGVNVSLTVFAGSSEIMVPATEDYFYFRMLLDSCSTDEIAEGGTNLLDMAQTAEKEFIEAPVEKSVVAVLLTDGEDTGFLDLSKQALVEAEEALISQIAKTAALRWQVVALGSTQGAKVPNLLYDAAPVISSMRRSLLEKIANAGNGRLSVESQSSLSVLVDNILAEIAISQVRQEGDEQSPQLMFPLVISFFLLLAALSLPQQVIKRAAVYLIFFCSCSLGAASVQDRVDQACVLADAGRNDLAEKILRSLLTESLSTEEVAIVQYDLASVLMRSGKYKEALEIFQNVDIRNKVLATAANYEAAIGALLVAKESKEPKHVALLLDEARHFLELAKEQNTKQEVIAPLQLTHLAEEISIMAQDMAEALFLQHLDLLDKEHLIDEFTLFLYTSFWKLFQTADEPLYLEAFWQEAEFMFSAYCDRLLMMLQAPASKLQSAINSYLVESLRQFEENIPRHTGEELLGGFYQLIDLLRLIQAQGMHRDIEATQQNVIEKEKAYTLFETGFWEDQVEMSQEATLSYLKEKKRLVLKMSQTQDEAVKLLQAQEIDLQNSETVLKVDLLMDWIERWKLSEHLSLKSDVEWAIRFQKKLMKDEKIDEAYIQLQQMAVQKMLEMYPTDEVKKLLQQTLIALKPPVDMLQALGLLEKIAELLKREIVAPQEMSQTPKERIPNSAEASLRLLQEMEQGDKALKESTVKKVQGQKPW